MPAADVVVRVAHEHELDGIGDLCIAAYSAVGQLDPGDPYTQTLRDARTRSLQAELLVAMRGQEIVGTVTICPPGSRFAEVSHADEAEFRFLAVSPAAWRSGVGEALVEACEQRARERGARAHVICVVDGNDSAHRLYRRLGFTRLPERDWQPRPGIHLQAYTREVPYRG